MSDPHVAPDPIDQAYAQAEAMLDDEAARAARRAQVLGAVAAGAQPAPANQTLFARHGRWLAAASVAGLSLLIGLRYYQPAPLRVEAPSASPPTIAAPAAPMAGAPAAPTPMAPHRPVAARASSAPPTPAAPPAMATLQPRETPIPAAPMPAPPPPPPPARTEQAARAVTATTREALDAASGTAVEQVVVTGAFKRQGPSVEGVTLEALAPVPSQAAKLRTAAAAGRMAELRRLLKQGASVDQPDDDGETALMKAVRAKQPAAAKLLRRHGASLDVKNRAGQSARELAAEVNNRALNRALDLPK